MAGIQVFDATGAVVFDSLTSLGGVIAGTYVYQPGGTDTLLFPSFAGRTARINMITSGRGGPVPAIDYGLGYPRVTVSAGGFLTIFNVVIS